jgi:type II secretory pathway pseudopilin PulG
VSHDVASVVGRERGPGGFTLTGVVLSLSVVLLFLAAVGAPWVTEYRDQKRVEVTAMLLAEVRRGLSSAGTGFLEGVGANAGQLSELTTQIWNGRSGPPPFPKNSCGDAFTDRQVSNWDNAGPYLSFFVPRTGLVTPLGIAEDTLHRVPKSARPGNIQIVIKNVKFADASLFDDTIDAGDGNSVGTVQWSAPVAGLVTLFYQLPINDQC